MKITSPYSSSSSTSSSAATIASNHDLITQILVLLPVKSLIRFKSVSKHWLSLITDPFFSHYHTRCNTALVSFSSLLLTDPSRSQPYFLPLSAAGDTAPPPTFFDFITDPSDIKILQTSHGLFLCSTIHRLGRKSHFYICNPVTRQFSIIPDSPLPTVVLGCNFIFDPSKSHYYKVVCVHSSSISSNCFEILIYSSETKSWNQPCDSFNRPFDMVFRNGVLWNGAIHWMSPKGELLYFDVDGERLGKMPPVDPSIDPLGTRRFRYFGESNGHLHLIDVCGPRTMRFDVFEMEIDYSKWFVKFRVDLSGVIREYPEMVVSFLDPCDSYYYAFFVSGLFREDNEEDSTLVLHVPGKMLSYHFKDNSFNKLCDFGFHPKGRLQFGPLYAYPYAETLACV